MGELSPVESVALLVNMVLTLISPVLGLLVVVVMFIVGMIQGGNWLYAKATGIGFVAGIVLYYLMAVLLAVSLF